MCLQPERQARRLGDCVYPVPLQPLAVDGIATAVALIHRAVFEGMAAKHGQTWWHHIYLPKPGDEFQSLGEDLGFSIRAADCGFQSWAVHVPGLRHYKTMPLSRRYRGGRRGRALDARDGCARRGLAAGFRPRPGRAFRT